MKKPIVTLEQVKEIEKTYPTPFHIYDEKAIRENARALKEAFSWNKGYREYFAVKATPNPFILKILQEEGCGVDCSSLTELMLSEALDFKKDDIMFSSNVTPMEEYKKASELGAYINLDDFTHIDYLAEGVGIPETICCRYNPGGVFELGTDIMDNPGDAKYGFTKEQLIEGYKKLMKLGAKHFGIHAFIASNTVSNDYYPTLAGILFELAVELKEKTGADIQFINLSGGVGIPYTPDKAPKGIRIFPSSIRYFTAWDLYRSMGRNSYPLDIISLTISRISYRSFSFLLRSFPRARSSSIRFRTAAMPRTARSASKSPPRTVK